MNFPEMALVREAIRVVPAVKYALGVGGIAAVVSIVLTGVGLNAKTAVFGILITLALMVVLVVFSSLVGKTKSLYWPAMVLCWSFLILAIASTALFASSFFFDFPKSMKCLLGESECVAPQLLSEKFRRVDALLVRNLAGEAVLVAKEAVKIAPSSAEAHYLLGRATYEQGRYDDAISAFKDALKLDPQEVRRVHALGSTYAQIGRHREAIEYYEKVQKLNPTHAPTLYNLGHSYSELGENEKALAYYKQTIQLGTDNVPDAAFAIAKIQAMRMSGKGACDENSDAMREAFWALSIMVERGGDGWARVLLGQAPKRGVEQLDTLKGCASFQNALNLARRKVGAISALALELLGGG